MKKKTRALNALLLSLALILSLVPAASASSFCSLGHPTSPTGWQSANSSYHTQYCYMCMNTVYEAHQFSNGSCITCGYNSYTNPYNHVHTFNALGYCTTCGLGSSNQYNHTHSFNNSGVCTLCGYDSITGGYSHTHIYNELGYCTYCGIQNTVDQYDHTHSFNGTNTCTICGYRYTGQSNHTHVYSDLGYCVYCGLHSSLNQYDHTHIFDGTNTCTICGLGYGNQYNHTHVFNDYGLCTVCGFYSGNDYANHAHNFNGTDTCIICGYNYVTGQYDHNHIFSELGFCTVCGLYNGYGSSGHVHNFDSTNTCTICGYRNNGLYDHNHIFDINYTCTVCGYNSVTGQYNHTHTYNAQGYCTICGLYNGYGHANHTHSYDGTYTCTICGYNSLTGQYNHTHTYNTQGYCTICGLYNGYGHANHTHSYDGTYTCTICGYNYVTGQYNHTHTYNTQGYCTICGLYNGITSQYTNITYSADPGKTVKLTASDFQEFWQNRTSSSGTLKYIQITSVTSGSGTLCYNHSSSETSHNNANGSSFYLSPSSLQKDLSKLSFVPTKSNGKYPTGTVTINFTAYGTTLNNSQTSTTGTVTITYATTNVQPITYNCAGSFSTLDSKDFIKVYQNAGFSTSNFTIKFLDVPAYGKLYSAYTSYGATGTELTKTNIQTLSFSSSSSATNSIDKIAYAPGSAGLSESVRYAAYSGSTLLYIGTVTFNTKEIVINYTGNSTGTTFDYYDFYYSNTGFANLHYIAFGTPSSGTLYKNYANGKGTVVTSKDYFNHLGSSSVNAMSTLTFVPKANYTGVVEIPFTAYNLTGASFSGTVKVYVVAKPFSDISGWSTSYINRLYAAGVVGGTSATTFSPKANMKYGEALKMILLAAGYSKQSETSGKHWASNYLTLAYSKGIVSSTSIDLNALVDRNTVAELAAKALGLSKATYVNAGVTGPSDSTNGYVYALYNTGIVSGENVGSSNKFYGSRNITREEVAKIICNIMDYEK